MGKPSMADVYAAVDRAMSTHGAERATLMDKALILFREARAEQGPDVGTRVPVARAGKPATPDAS